MKKFKNCFDTAIRLVLNKKNTENVAHSVRNVSFVPFLDDETARGSMTEEEEEEEDEKVDVPIKMEKSGPLVVRSISGKAVFSQEIAGNGMRVGDIVSGVCQSMQARSDEVKIMAGSTLLEHTMVIGHGHCVSHPGPGKTLGLSVIVVRGPPVIALSSSGSRIGVLDGVPGRQEVCHFDRNYVFTSLGGFADKEGMQYVKTCNDDRKTPARGVMWQLDLREAAVVFINFRSQEHIQNGGAHEWLARDGWELKPDFESTVSSGYPNGPYHGPVYAKTFHPQSRKHVVDLMGSNYWEGTYFVFVQLISTDDSAESMSVPKNDGNRLAQSL